MHDRRAAQAIKDPAAEGRRVTRKTIAVHRQRVIVANASAVVPTLVVAESSVIDRGGAGEVVDAAALVRREVSREGATLHGQRSRVVNSTSRAICSTHPSG